MPGWFYVEGTKEKIDFTEVRSAISEVQNGITQVQDDVTTLVAKSEGISPVTGSTSADWQAAESEVTTIGAPNARYKVHSLVLGIHNLAGNAVTVRMYMAVNGNEQKVYEQAFDVSGDTPGLWIINGTVGIHDSLRITLQSNNAADNGRAVDYDYMVEVMR